MFGSKKRSILISQMLNLLMITKKDRRHNGYVTPKSFISGKDLEKFGITIDTFYDDWEDYRDGFRDWFRDFKLIKLKTAEFGLQE